MKVFSRVTHRLARGLRWRLRRLYFICACGLYVIYCGDAGLTIVFVMIVLQSGFFVLLVLHVLVLVIVILVLVLVRNLR